MWMLIILIILLAIMPSNKAKSKHRNNNRFHDEPFYEVDDTDDDSDLDFSKEDDEFFEDLIMFDEIDDED